MADASADLLEQVIAGNMDTWQDWARVAVRALEDVLKGLLETGGASRLLGGFLGGALAPVTTAVGSLTAGLPGISALGSVGTAGGGGTAATGPLGGLGSVGTTVGGLVGGVLSGVTSGAHH